LPEAFLATDGILVLATNVAAGLEVREAVIARRVQEAMPFLATERWLVRGVKAGGNRQELHEVIRGHSLAVAQAVAEAGAASDLPLPLLRRGKVREVYEVDADTLLLVASDRVSAFDVVLKEPVPHKGAVLTQLSAFWFGKLAAVMPSHFLTADADEIAERVP